MAPKPKPPTAPPSLATLSARVEQLEFDRRLKFTQWKAAIEAANGNITKAAECLKPPITKSRAMFLTKSLGLREYAAALRVRAGHTELGRPWPKK